MEKAAKDLNPAIRVERLTELKDSDLDDLCEAMEKTIEDGLGFSLGFGWLKVPARDRLESYWKGLLLVPDREIFVGRVDDINWDLDWPLGFPLPCSPCSRDC